MKLPDSMHAMILGEPKQMLTYQEIPMPAFAANEMLVKVLACGICRTDLHVIDGDLTHPKLPLILGHEIIGRVAAMGDEVKGFKAGDLVGIPWLGYTCGVCKFCKSGKENLCDHARFTGYTINGGFAEYTVAGSGFCFLLSPEFGNPSSAPLLCAGLIGFRSYRMIDPSAKNIGIYGFGAAAHILIQISRAQGKNIFAFTREGDTKAQQFAKQMGAHWAGGSNEDIPEKLDAAIIFAAVGELIPEALKAVDKGGQVICGGIHMSDLPSFSYDLLWEERSLKSVANMTRQDGLAFFEALKTIPVHTQIHLFKLHEANEAIQKLRNGEINGAAVLVMDQ
jgi:propanol-preferring alcohol dehydrogenase